MERRRSEEQAVQQKHETVLMILGILLPILRIVNSIGLTETHLCVNSLQYSSSIPVYSAVLPSLKFVMKLVSHPLSPLMVHHEYPKQALPLMSDKVALPAQDIYKREIN